MTLDDFKSDIKSKTFRSTDGTKYRFIPENTLQVNGSFSHSVHYSIEAGESEDRFLLLHNSLLGTEPIELEIIPTPKSRMELKATTLFKREFIGTWIEQQDSFV